MTLKAREALPAPALWPLGAALLAWTLFLLTRPALPLATPEAGWPWVVWLWPRPARLLPWALAGPVLVGAGYALQLWLLTRREGGRPPAATVEAAAAAWWPSLALLLIPLLELARPLHGLSLAPLALAEEAWPLAGLAALLAVAGQTRRLWPAPEPAIDRPRPWLAPLVFLLALALFAAMGLRLHQVTKAVGPFMGGDEPQYLFITHSLAVDHDLDLSNNIMLRENAHYTEPGKLIGGHSTWTAQGTYVSKHRPGLPLLMAPFYAWGLYAGVGVRRVCVMAAWLLAAWMVLEVFLLARNLTGRQRPALWAAAAAGACMPAVIYSNLLFPEMAAAAFAVSAFRLIVQTRPGQWPLALAAGILTAYLAWFHERFIPLSLILGMCFLRRTGRRDLKGLAAFFLPCLLSAAWLLSYFHSLYGRLLPPTNLHGRASYFNPRGAWEGLSGLWVDAAEGLLPYGALWMAAVAGLVWLIRRDRQAGLWASLMVACTYLVAGFFDDWFGGINPPSRYLVVAIPFLALGLAAGLAWAPARFGLVAAFLACLTLLADSHVWRHPASVYGHKVQLGGTFMFPIVENWLPTFLLLDKTPAVNASLALVWMLAAGAVVLVLQLGQRQPTPRGALALTALTFVLVTGAATAADLVGPSLRGEWQSHNVLRSWQRLAGLEPAWGVWPDLGPERPRPPRLNLPPRRYRHGPVKLTPQMPDAVTIPPGQQPFLVLWGQYLDLPAGRYRLTTRLDSQAQGSEPVAEIDVAHDLGRTVVTRRLVTGAQAGQPVVLDFSLERPASKLECRLSTKGASGLVIERMYLEREF